MVQRTVGYKMNHGELCAWCALYLNKQGFFAWVNRTGAVKRYGVMVQYGKKGSTDVVCALPAGRMLWVEVKVRKEDVLSEKQIEFRDKVMSLGHHWLEVRKPEDLTKYVEGKIRGEIEKAKNQL